MFHCRIIGRSNNSIPHRHSTDGSYPRSQYSKIKLWNELDTAMAAPSGLGVKTHLAEKYSHPTGDIHDVLRNYYPSLKSGLTPVTPGPHANQQEAWIARKLPNTTAKRYSIYPVGGKWLTALGFTAREYADLDSLAASVDLSDNDSLLEFLDSSPIHPFYSKRNWRVPMTANLARYPLGDGNEYVRLCIPQ